MHEQRTRACVHVFNSPVFLIQMDRTFSNLDKPRPQELRLAGHHCRAGCLAGCASPLRTLEERQKSGAPKEVVRACFHRDYRVVSVVRPDPDYKRSQPAGCHDLSVKTVLRQRLTLTCGWMRCWDAQAIRRSPMIAHHPLLKGQRRQHFAVTAASVRNLRCCVNPFPGFPL